MFDLIIVGGGAAGSMAASLCNSVNTLILEGSDRLMKKLELSGAGRCNLTHSGDIKLFFSHYGKGNELFVRKALYSFDNHAIAEYLKSMGVSTVTLENGKVFPHSDTSTVIVDAISKKINENGVTVKTNSKVTSVKSISDGFRVTTFDGRTYFSNYLLLAGGGRSFYKTGSDGSCFKLSKSLGHSVTPHKPALTPVYSDKTSSGFVELAGTVLDGVDISIVSGDSAPESIHTKINGQLLFTHRGLSGPVILDGSRYMNPGDLLIINFAKDNMSRSQFESKLISTADSAGSQMLSTFMRKFSKTVKIGDFVFKSSTSGIDFKLSELPKSIRKKAAKSMCTHEFKIHGTGGYEVAMATHGGVTKSEINSKTMESRIVKKLFFAGEVIDIDGDTGGYNIQWAFSSANLAMSHILKVKGETE